MSSISCLHLVSLQFFMHHREQSYHRGHECHAVRRGKQLQTTKMSYWKGLNYYHLKLLPVIMELKYCLYTDIFRGLSVHWHTLL